MGNLHEEIYSPSKAELWINCAKSYDYEKHYDFLKSREPQEKYRARKRVEGSRAHVIAARELIIARNKALGLSTDEEEGYYVDDEDMLFYAKKYVNIVMKEFLKLRKEDEHADMWVEHTIDCTEYGGNCVGTADAYMVGNQKMIVVDYKYGTTAVDAEENDQLRIYALGALNNLRSFANEVQEIELLIYQPRCGGLKSEILSRKELIEWGNSVLREALYAVQNRTYYPAKAGEWCEYCRGKDCCPVYYRDRYVRLHSYDFLDEYEIARMKDLIQKQDALKKYIEEEKIEELPEVNCNHETLDLVKELLRSIKTGDDGEALNKLPIQKLEDNIPQYNEKELYLVKEGIRYPILSIRELRKIFWRIADRDNNSPAVIVDEKNNISLLIGLKSISQKVEKKMNSMDDMISTNLVLEINYKDYVLVEKDTYRKYQRLSCLMNDCADTTEPIYRFSKRVIDKISELKEEEDQTKKDDNTQNKLSVFVQKKGGEVYEAIKRLIKRVMRKKNEYENFGGLLKIPLKDGYALVPDDWTILDDYFDPAEHMYAGVVEISSKSLNREKTFTPKHFVFFSDYRYGADYPDGFDDLVYAACCKKDRYFRKVKKLVVKPLKAYRDGILETVNEKEYLSSPRIGTFHLPQFGDPMYWSYPGYTPPYGAMIVQD